MSTVRKLCAAHDITTDIGLISAAISLGLMFAVFCIEVGSRYFLGIALSWSNDMFSNFMIVSIFAIVPHVARVKMHISLTLLEEMYPRFKRPLGYFTNVSGFLICVFLTYICFNENLRQVALGVMTQQNHPLPMVWFTVFLTFGFASSALYFLRSMFDRPATAVRSWVWHSVTAVQGVE